MLSKAILSALAVSAVGLVATSGGQQPATTEVDLTGTWEFTDLGVTVALFQDGSKVDSRLIKSKCTEPRDQFLNGTLRDGVLTGEVRMCMPTTQILVKDCGFPVRWDTKFRLVHGPQGLTGTWQNENFQYTYGPDGRATDCRFQYYFDVAWVGKRTDLTR